MAFPAAGAVTLLRNDPFTQGPKLFAKKCASCHRYDGHDGTGFVPKDSQTASDLKGFGTREWLAGLLDPAKIVTAQLFWRHEVPRRQNGEIRAEKRARAFTPEEKEKLKKVIAAVSAEAGLKSQVAADARDQALITEGRTLLPRDMKCADCHQFHKKDEDATAPNLTGYASREWLTRFLANPGHDDFYGSRNDRMPAFGADQILNEQAIALIVDWLRGSWSEPETTASIKE